MDSKRIAATFVAASAFLSASAIASGYGPAPFYRPSVGAPVSQRGQSKVLTGGLAEQHRAIPTAVRRRLRLAGVMRMFPARAPLKAIDLNATRRMQLYVEKLEELPTGPKGS
jgi:hypothetical protein